MLENVAVEDRGGAFQAGADTTKPCRRLAEAALTVMPMGLRIGAVTVDSHDPGRLARFWAEALDWVISRDEDPEWVVEPSEGSRDDCVVADLLFIKVPEPKTSKNRLHFDLRPEDQSTEVARLEGLGATRVDIGQGDDQAWVVMADPEGNEFCVQDAHPPQVREQWLQRYEAYQPVRT